MVEELLGTENELINIMLVAIGLLLLMALTIVIFFYFSRKRISKTQLEKANLEIEHQKNLLQSIIVTQEEERKRIAQDMHDAISSKLNVVSLNANFLIDPSITLEEANKMGESILKVTTTVLDSSRRIAHDLLPPMLDKFGLEAALEELCDEVGEAQKFSIDFQVNYKEETLSSNEELHLFRIAQELFNNSIKYSEASKIVLHVKQTDNSLLFNYRDDGKGFHLSDAKNAKGLGMSGIENRVELLDATLQIETSPGNGMEISIEKVLE